MNTSVTVYTLPHCMQCSMTKRALDLQGTIYTAVDLAENPAAIDRMRLLGHTAAPVVVAGSTSWSGFRPDMIRSLRTPERERAGLAAISMVTTTEGNLGDGEPIGHCG